MTAKYFVDTNVLLYAVDSGAGTKRGIARHLLGAGSRGSEKVISTQVLQEFYAAATRKLKLTPQRARDMTMLWTRYRVIAVDAADVMTAVDCSIAANVSVWDALIAVAARKAGCGVLWTEDLNHGQIIHGVRVENPFLATGGPPPAMARESRATAYRAGARRKKAATAP